MSDTSIAERLVAAIAATRTRPLPGPVLTTARHLLLDVTGLCVAARNGDYTRCVVASLDAGGPCTAIGQTGGFTPEAAAVVNGTAAHGEDFDDTFEGGPVHSGAVIVPAVLAAAERHGASGADLIAGLAIGCEVLCRASTVAPRAIHQAGFHPTGVLGAIGAAAAAGVTLRLEPARLVSALGIAGSMASGIIEYLAEGTWTKRLHPGWAAQSGYRAAMLARAGFAGPRTVLEGRHGLYNGFARTSDGDWGALLDGFGSRWVASTIAFKPYACGTMMQPYIDCARKLRSRGIAPEAISKIVCETAEGFVHRLWEPLADKQAPANGYAAKFSVPYGIAIGLIHGDAGLAAFDDGLVCDARIVALARKVGYVIDPDHPYPRQYTGHLRATLAGGTVIEERQPHLRGGAAEPLSSAEIEAKFRANCRHGGWSDERASATLGLLRDLPEAAKVDFAALRG
jgi:2-methylcitrate dehydratase PrpD